MKTSHCAGRETRHDVRKRIGEDFMRRWLEKSEREQAAARAVMRWR